MEKRWPTWRYYLTFPACTCNTQIFYNVESRPSHILLIFKGIFPKSNVFSTLVNRLRTKINLKKREKKILE